MGLDTTHGCWHGPYSAFARWREAVQTAAGWPMRSVSDDGVPFRETTVINWAALSDENFEGEWDSIPEDPLVVLVAHSDCSGIIPIPALLPLADRLEELAARMGPTDGEKPNSWLAENQHPVRPPRANYDGERAATLRFVAGLREAARLKQPVEFH